MRDFAEEHRNPHWSLQGWHVLAIFVAFFGVIFAVNGYFLFSALSTHTGVVAVEPYRKGLAYNDRIAAGERQAALGWTEAVSISADGHVRVAMTAKEGTPVGGLSIVGTIGRPSTTRGESKLVFREVAAGQYEAVARAIEPGNWLVAIEARAGQPEDPDFRAKRRIWLKP